MSTINPRQSHLRGKHLSVAVRQRPALPGQFPQGHESGFGRLANRRFVYLNGGNLLQFGPAWWQPATPGFPIPRPGNGSTTSVFKVLPAYTQRTNPWYYDGLRGPMYWEVQAAISKSFPITEKIRADFAWPRSTLTNRLNRADPDLVGYQRDLRPGAPAGTNLPGRQIEFGMKIVF